MRIVPRALVLFVVVVVGLLATGCTATSKYMVKAPGARAIARDPAKATVVFVRPSGYASNMRTTILDDHGRFLGDSLPKSFFAVKVAPGEHLFIAWAENTAALKATLEPNKIYFVEVSSKMGAFSARMHLLGITPRSETWTKLDEWLGDSEPYTTDERAGQAYLRERAADVTERIDRGREALSKYDAKELADRTIGPQDGK